MVFVSFATIGVVKVRWNGFANGGFADGKPLQTILFVIIK